jgi:hypothetical protein
MRKKVALGWFEKNATLLEQTQDEVLELTQ